MVRDDDKGFDDERETQKNKGRLTLGMNLYLPTGYMVSTWWVLKQNTQHGPTGSILITF